MNKNDSFKCEFCESGFNTQSNLLRHLKTSKKCLDSRPKIDIVCVWCEEVFLSKDRLEKHTSKCGINKDIAYISLKEKNKSLEQQLLEKDKSLEDKDKHIKELEEKIYNLANKTTTTNNTTYNITLNCDKPLLLSLERVSNLMWKYFTFEDMKNGGYGYGRWFLEHVAINEKGNICIECTDKKRKIFKYIDDDNKLMTKEASDLVWLIRQCCRQSNFYSSSPQGITFEKYTSDPNNYRYIKSYNNFDKSFIEYMVSKTHKNSLVKKELYSSNEEKSSFNEL